MRYSRKTLMAFGVMVIAVGMIITALKWPLRTGIFVLVIGIPVFFMAMVESYLNLIEKEKGDSETSGANFEFTENTDPAVLKGRVLLIFLWMVGFFFLIVFVGFPIAVLLFFFFYLKLKGKERWGISLGLAFVGWAFFYSLFVWLLDTRFPQGLLQKTLMTFGIG